MPPDTKLVYSVSVKYLLTKITYLCLAQRWNHHNSGSRRDNNHRLHRLLHLQEVWTKA